MSYLTHGLRMIVIWLDNFDLCYDSIQMCSRSNAGYDRMTESRLNQQYFPGESSCSCTESTWLKTHHIWGIWVRKHVTH